MELVKYCTKDDVENLMSFLGRNWKKNHILSNNKRFFNWQFYNKHTQKYNFLISIKNTKIVGCLGFIPNSHFSKTLKKNDTIWLVNWLIIKNLCSSLLLLSKTIKKKHHYIGTTGNTINTELILNNIGFETGYLNHWYFTNPAIKKFNLIKIKSSKKINNKKKITHNYIKKITRLNDIKKISINNDNNKNYFFFKKRYLEHPIYKYQFFGIYNKGTIKSFFVARICSHKNNDAIRIVDFCGNIKHFYKLNVQLSKLLEQHSAEYIDFYEYGSSIDNKKFPFKLNGYNKEIIIPDYFEPFVKKNIKIRYAFNNNTKNKIIIYKGDCDQDRPS